MKLAIGSVDSVHWFALPSVVGIIQSVEGHSGTKGQRKEESGLPCLPAVALGPPPSLASDPDRAAPPALQHPQLADRTSWTSSLYNHKSQFLVTSPSRVRTQEEPVGSRDPRLTRRMTRFSL